MTKIPDDTTPDLDVDALGDDEDEEERKPKRRPRDRRRVFPKGRRGW